VGLGFADFFFFFREFFVGLVLFCEFFVVLVL
jgi:hypothetical protein